MFRFRLGPIPVEVRPSHLGVSAIFAYSFLPGPRSVVPQEWPYLYLVDPSNPRYATTLVAFILLWMAVIFVSVLVHELGHAVVSHAYGYRPEITLVGFGGHTQPHAEGEIPWKKDILLTLAGPGFGLLLAALARAAAHGEEVLPRPALFACTIAYEANVFWAILNLLPVNPLDGGRICSTLSMRLFGRRGFLLAQVVGLLLSGLLVAWGALQGLLFLAIMFGLLAARTVSLIAAYLRGELPPHPENEETSAILSRAEEAFARGERKDAKKLATDALQISPAMFLRSRAHRLLGWIALKEGDGRAALDHFSQVQRMPIESHALAAAFSLVGDDARSLPLWEKAFIETKNATVLHEWAGALIRLGRESEAFSKPGVQPEKALACAEHIFFARGEFEEAARVGEAALLRAPSAEVAYDTACAYARAGNTQRAMALLKRAWELGFTDKNYAAQDSDLQSLHGTSDFQTWMASLPESDVR
jgi:Zn-dependent protease